MRMLTPTDLESEEAPPTAPLRQPSPGRLAAASVCAVLLVLLIAGSLCSPAVKLYLRPALAWRVLPWIIRAYQHRILHILGFALPATMLFGLCRTRGAALGGACLLISTGVALEYIQHRLYHNPLEWWDIRDNLTGILIGALAITVYRLTLTRQDGDRAAL